MMSVINKPNNDQSLFLGNTDITIDRDVGSLRTRWNHWERVSSRSPNKLDIFALIYCEIDNIATNLK